MHRCIIFAHYDRDGVIDAHVIYLLRCLRKHTDRLVFVSTSAKDSQLSNLDGLCDTAISRENIGYDFMSWKCGISYIPDINSYDEILFVNDSIYGPLNDLDLLFKKSDQFQADFWGLTYCHHIKPHIQSYFFAFRKTFVDNGVFRDFWRTVEPLDDKSEIILRYEVGMTQFIRDRGAKFEYFFDQFNLNVWGRTKTFLVNGRRKDRSLFGSLRWYIKSRITNPTHTFWLPVINSNIPFLKVELMRDNPLGIPLSKIYQQIEKYPYSRSLIKQHLNRIS